MGRALDIARVACLLSIGAAIAPLTYWRLAVVMVAFGALLTIDWWRTRRVFDKLATDLAAIGGK